MCEEGMEGGGLGKHIVGAVRAGAMAPEHAGMGRHVGWGGQEQRWGT